MDGQQIRNETRAHWPEWATSDKIEASLGVLAAVGTEADAVAFALAASTYGVTEAEHMVAMAVYGATSGAASLGIIDVDDGADDTVFKMRLEQMVNVFRAAALSARKSYLAERRAGRL